MKRLAQLEVFSIFDYLTLSNNFFFQCNFLARAIINTSFYPSEEIELLTTLNFLLRAKNSFCLRGFLFPEFVIAIIFFITILTYIGYDNYSNTRKCLLALLSVYVCLKLHNISGIKQRSTAQQRSAPLKINSFSLLLLLRKKLTLIAIIKNILSAVNSAISLQFQDGNVNFQKLSGSRSAFVGEFNSVKGIDFIAYFIHEHSILIFLMYALPSDLFFAAEQWRVELKKYCRRQQSLRSCGIYSRERKIFYHFFIAENDFTHVTNPSV
jgi:hypothetical protein